MTVDHDLRHAADRLLHDVRGRIDTDAALHAVTDAGTAPAKGGRSRWLAVAAALAVVAATVAAVAGSRGGAHPEVATETTTTTTDTLDVDPGGGLRHNGATDGTESRLLPVTVTPSTGLTPDQEVIVVGEGFAPDEPVGIVMCTADALARGAGSDGCDLGVIVSALPDAAGRVEAPFPARRAITTPEDGYVDCATGEETCGIAVGQVSDYDVSGLAPVVLAPLAPLPEPVVTVAPAADLAHGQVVTVSGEGFVSLPIWEAQLCAVDGGDADADADAPAYTGGPPCVTVPLTVPVEGAEVAPADGRFSVEVPLWRVIPTADGVVDCAVEACVVRLAGGDGREAAPVPVAFDPALPVPARPVLAVSPSTGLRPGDTVTVTVTEADPGQALDLSACAVLDGTGSVLDGCTPMLSLGQATADAEGRAVVTLTVPDPTTYGVDCSREGACALTLGSAALDGDPTLRARRPVALVYAP